MNVNKAISEARVILTELLSDTLHGPDSSCPLKMNRMMAELERGLEELQSVKKQSAFDKVKAAMFDDDNDRRIKSAYNSVIDLTYQLGLCRRCECADCAKLSDICSCDGCMFGSKVAACSKEPVGFETRLFERDVASINGEPLIKSEFDRKNRICAVTVLQPNGVERKFLQDI